LPEDLETTARDRDSDRHGLSWRGIAGVALAVIAVLAIVISVALLVRDDGSRSETSADRDAGDRSPVLDDEFMVESLALGVRSQHPQVDEEQAACVADGMLRELGRERITELVVANLDGEGFSDAGAALPAEAQQQITDVMLDCLPAAVLQQIMASTATTGVEGLPGEAN
jgi:hypothetical protein